MRLTWLLLHLVSPSLLSHPLHQVPVGAVVVDVLVPGVAAAIDPHWASADPAHHQCSEAAQAAGRDLLQLTTNEGNGLHRHYTKTNSRLVYG